MLPWQKENLIGVNLVANKNSSMSSLHVNIADVNIVNVNLEIKCLLPIRGIMQILGFIGETIGDAFLDLSLDPLAYFFAFGASQLRSQNQGSSRRRRPRRPGSLNPSFPFSIQEARTSTSCGSLLKPKILSTLSYHYIQQRNEMINPDVRPENLTGENVGRPTWCHLLSEKSIDSFAESRHKRPVNKKI